MSEDEVKSVLDQIDILMMNLDSFAALVNGLVASIQESGVPEDTITKFNNLSSALIEQKKDLETFKNKVSELFSKIKDAYEKKIEDMNLRISELEEAVKSKDAELEELRSSLSDKESKIKHLEEELVKLKDNISAKELEISKISAELNDAKNKISDLENKLRQKEDLASSLQSRVSNLESEINKLREEYNNEISRIKGEHSKEINKLREEYRNKVSELEKAISDKNSEIAELKNKVSNLESELDQKRKQLEDAQNLIKKYEGEVAAVEFARALLATHPDAHALRVLPVMLSVGEEKEGYICCDQTKFMMRTKKTFMAIKPLLERTFKSDWYMLSSGIPPKLCIRKDILEAIRKVFEA